MSPNEISLSDADIAAKMRLLRETVQSKTSETEEKVKPPFKREIVWKNVVVYVIGHALGLWGLYLTLFDMKPLHILYGKGLVENTVHI